jgi:hypothetical protein
MAAYRLAATNLNHVGLIPEVQHALVKWIKATVPGHRGILIGGLAMSFYAKPRTTDDVDMLFVHTSDIPNEVMGFKRYRPGAFREHDTHVDIELTTPASFDNLPIEVVRKVIGTAVDYDGLKVASREGMIALKLCGAQTPRRMHKDLGDVVLLLEGDIGLLMDDWPLNQKAFHLLGELRIQLGESS